jgi:alpha-1,3-mannosyltransferase
MQQQHWHLALTVFSAAVSVKMNVLLFAPPLLLLLFKVTVDHPSS